MRTTLVSLGHPRIEDRRQSFILDEVCKAYHDKDEAKLKPISIRAGLPANIIFPIVKLGLTSEVTWVLRDCAMITVSIIHGLRERSAETVPALRFKLDSNKWNCLVTILKGSTVQASSKHGSGRYETSEIRRCKSTPMELLTRWISNRESKSAFFYMAEAPPDLNDAVKSILSILSVNAPDSFIFQRHSCRISAYTEIRLYKEVSFDVILTQFN